MNDMDYLDRLLASTKYNHGVRIIDLSDSKIIFDDYKKQIDN